MDWIGRWRKLYRGTANIFASLPPALASFVVPGLGQWINGHRQKGLLIFIIYLSISIFPLVFIGFLITSIVNYWQNQVPNNLAYTGFFGSAVILLCVVFSVALPFTVVFAVVDAHKFALRRRLEREKIIEEIVKDLVEAKVSKEEIMTSGYSSKFSLTNPDDWPSILKKAMEESDKKRGKFNILIMGKTGVGKSTLVNTVFQGNFADTGKGRPVTATVTEYTKEGIPLVIFDTPGLELARTDIVIRDLNQLIKERMADPDLSKHIHLAWYCIAEDSHKVEESETRLTEIVAKWGIPIIVVITKAKADDGFKSVVQKLLPNASNIVRVRALPYVLDDGYKLQPMGLDNLIELTWELVPQAQRDALAASLKSIQYKEQQSRVAVVSAATAAAGIAATPIPFSDAFLLIPLQVTMLATISSIYGLKIDKAFLGTLISGAITGTFGRKLGAWAVASLLKLIPGAGTVVSGMVNAAVAAALTQSFGEAYIRTLSIMLKTNPERMPLPEEIHDSFESQLKQQKAITVTGQEPC